VPAVTYTRAVQWVECVPNISEGRDLGAIAAVGEAIRGVPGVRFLHSDSDVDHNRTVLTFVGPPRAIVDAAFACVAEAARRIDLTAHEGQHPRLGAADVVPFVPLEEVSLAECGALARRLAARIESELAIPTGLYGAACPEATPLPAARKRGGSVHETAGRTLVGAREVLIAYNVQLETEDVGPAREIARIVRQRLPAVRALGFLLENRGCAQVSMNLIDYRETPPAAAFRAVRDEAAARDIGVRDSEIVGMAPADAFVEGFLADARCAAPAILDPAPSFLDALAAVDPVPAGAAAAAHAGAMAAALVSMVSEEPDVRARAHALRKRLESMVERDTAAYHAYMAAPGDEALEPATLAPLEIVEMGAELLALARGLEVRKSRRVDLRGAERLAAAAIDQARETVEENLRFMADEAVIAEIRRRLQRIR